MSGFLAFCDKYSDEQTCIAALADLQWSGGFTCDKCQSVKAYHLESRPRIYECATGGYQHSVTAGTILHKTRTPLRKWFMAAYLIGHDKRGVSALFISRELRIRYATAWLLCHKLRHALTGFTGYTRLDGYYHSPIVQGTGANAGVNMPVVHKLFSNIKTWLNGTYHGVSTKHLPRYLREWSYRFNRRHSVNVLDSFVMRRAANKPTITYAELVGGRMAEGAA